MPIYRSYMLAGSVALMLLALGQAGAMPQQQNSLPAEMIGASWELHTLQGAAGQSVAVQGSGITISFAADGTASGSGGCNNFRGSYTAGASNAVSFGPLAATRKACEPAVSERETAYFSALDNVASYALSGASLTLNSADGAVQLVYQRATAAQLPNTGAGAGIALLLIVSVVCMVGGAFTLRRTSVRG